MKIISLIFIVAFLCLAVKAQTTEFTYQGRLNDNGTAANSTYDFQLKLFNAASGGTQIGATQILNGVSVVNGIFTVRVSFGYGGAVFDGSATYLEISVKRQADADHTMLAPRQPVTSAPYSIRSLQSTSSLSAVDAMNLGGFAASQYVQTNDARLTDARNPLAGSPNYIQNQTTTPQLSAGFNIGGDGTTSGTFSGYVVNAQTQFNLNNSRVLSQPGANNLFIGGASGASNTSGDSNLFVGQSAGLGNTSGRFNTFVGTASGQSNTTGQFNTFVGGAAGASNTTGTLNSFFGRNAGLTNSTGFQNSFFGESAGLTNSSGSNNSFFGFSTGEKNTTGSSNSFFGVWSGKENTTGIFNAFFGRSSGEGNTTGEDNSFFGSFAGIANQTGSRNSFFGKDAGALNTAGTDNSFFGNRAGYSNTAAGNTFIGNRAGVNNTTGTGNVFVGNNAGNENQTGSRITLIGAGAVNSVDGLTNATAIGADALITQSNSLVLGSVGVSSVNVGINTTAPKAKLHIVGGKIYIESNGQGVILKSPGGSCFEMTVTNAGALTTATVACP